MRVIAGKARRLPLVAPEGKDTRPTTDRIKETLFNIIQTEVPGSDFLDLFSGSGGIGIEALSRGAKSAVFVEIAKEALSCIEANLKKTRLKEEAVVLPMEVSYGIKKLERMGRTFDIVYMDPPYRKGYEQKMLGILANSKIIKEDSLIILESALETPVDYVDDRFYELERIKEYKTNQHIFLRRKK